MGDVASGVSWKFQRRAGTNENVSRRGIPRGLDSASGTRCVRMKHRLAIVCFELPWTRREGALGASGCNVPHYCGYAPQRQLAAWILPCEVIVPALIPRRPGVRMAREAEARQRGTLSGSRRGRGTAAPFPAPAGVAPADQDRRARTVSSLRPHPPPPGLPSSARQTGAGEPHKDNKEATSRILA